MNRVVFACVQNAGRSQMAAAFFNNEADRAKAVAISAGTAPGPRVHPEVVEVMREAGIDLSNARPRAFTPEIADEVTLLVTMGCGDTCPVAPGTETIDWPLPDPHGQPIARVREIRDAIRDRVRGLLRERGWSRSDRV